MSGSRDPYHIFTRIMGKEFDSLLRIFGGVLASTRNVHSRRPRPGDWRGGPRGMKRLPLLRSVHFPRSYTNRIILAGRPTCREMCFLNFVVVIHFPPLMPAVISAIAQ